MTEDRRVSDFEPSMPDLATAGGPRRLRDEPLLRLLAINWLIGAVVAGGLAALVIVTDTAHLRSLILASGEPWIGVLLLVFGFMITMCSVAMGTAVMMLPKDDDDDGPGGGTAAEVLKAPRRAPAELRGLKPAPVRVGVVTGPRHRRAAMRRSGRA